MWSEIICEYTEKGTYAQMDLQTKFLKSKCTTGSDVRQFPDELRTKRDELSAVGVQIEEKDYRSTIIQSLPHHLAAFASGQLATARLYSSTKTIDPDILISLIIEESERHNSHDGCPPRTNTKPGGSNQVMGVTDGDSRGRGGGCFRGQGSHTNRQGCVHPLCWNCGSWEHFKATCPELDKSAGSRVDATRGSAHAAADDDDDKDDSVFAVEYDTDLESVCSLPALLPTESSDGDAAERLDFIISDDDWFSDLGDDDIPSLDDWDNQSAAICSESDTSSFVDLGEDLSAKVSQGCEDGAIVELYNSGTMRHISPYRDHFETLSDIPPKPFTATNQQFFNAIGTGEMVIEVPNGVDVSQL